MADFDRFKAFYRESTGNEWPKVEKGGKGAKKTAEGAKDEGEKRKKLSSARIRNT